MLEQEQGAFFVLQNGVDRVYRVTWWSVNLTYNPSGGSNVYFHGY